MFPIYVLSFLCQRMDSHGSFFLNYRKPLNHHPLSLTHTACTFFWFKFIHVLKPRSWWWTERSVMKSGVEDDLKLYFIDNLHVESFVLSPISNNRCRFSSVKSAIQGGIWFSLEAIKFCKENISEWSQVRETWLCLLTDYCLIRRGGDETIL